MDYNVFSKSMQTQRELLHKIGTFVEDNHFDKAVSEIIELQSSVKSLRTDPNLEDIEKSVSKRLKQAIEQCRDIEKRRAYSQPYWDHYRQLISNLVEIKLLIFESAPAIINHESEMKSTLLAKDELKKWWFQNIYNAKVYHGTSNFSMGTIQKYGLAPGMRPQYWDDIKRLVQIIRKSGNSRPLEIVHLCDGTKHGQLVENGFFVTSNYNMAKEYATKSPAIWFEFVGTRDYRRARLKLLSEIFFHRIPAYKRIPISIYEETYKIREKDIKNGYDNTIKYALDKYSHLTRDEVCPLTKAEFNEMIRIFERLWLYFAQERRGYLLHIYLRAPAIANTQGFTGGGKSFITDFDAFYRRYLAFEHVVKVKGMEILKNFILDIHQLLITDRVPAEFIQIEELK